MEGQRPGAGEAEGEGGLDGDRVLVWEDQKVLEMMVVMVTQRRECT